MGEAVGEVVLSRSSVSGTSADVRGASEQRPPIKVTDVGKRTRRGRQGRHTVRRKVTAIIQSVMSVNIAMKNVLCLAAIFARVNVCGLFFSPLFVFISNSFLVVSVARTVLR